MVSYGECWKNHAVATGGQAFDGCRVFTPASGGGGGGRELYCDACGCHRSYHRPLLEEAAALTTSLILVLPPSHCFSAGLLAAPPSLPSFSPVQQPTQLLASPVSVAPLATQPVSSLSPLGAAVRPAAPPHDTLSKIRRAAATGKSHFRPITKLTPAKRLPLPPPPGYHAPLQIKQEVTDDREATMVVALVEGIRRTTSKKSKFTAEQREKMKALAVRVGWRVSKDDEAAMRAAAEEIGIEMNSLKVWINNHRRTLGLPDGGGGGGGSSSSSSSLLM